MKRPFLIALLCMASTAMASEIQVASMYALFSGQSDKSRHTFEIKQSFDGKWSYTEFKNCDYYPCEATAERLNSMTVTPEITSPTNMPDAGIRIQLDKNIELHFVNNGLSFPQKPPYYELVISDEGGSTVDKVKLNFESVLVRH